MSQIVNGKLFVTVLEGRELKKEDLVRNDNYVKVKVHNKILGTGKKTQISKGSNPRWGETIEFDLKDTDLKTKISFRVYDKDTLKDDKVGRCDLTLAQLASHPSSEWLQIHKFHDTSKITGYLLISAKFEGSGWPTRGVDQSMGTSQQPMGTSQQQPMGSSQQQPIGSSQQYGTSQQQPIGSSQQYGTSQQPIGTSQSISAQQPINNYGTAQGASQPISSSLAKDPMPSQYGATPQFGSVPIGQPLTKDALASQQMSSQYGDSRPMTSSTTTPSQI